MGGLSSGKPALRVERGRASEEELAALAVVLLALHREDARPREVRGASRARWWAGLEKYKAPCSWR